ncbi:MAG TPA: glutathione peroxidase, partial [Thermoanaerobaculia bacterium]|nr:glutathione peroxidase [Thermoanaerobaculia bacterium]
MTRSLRSSPERRPARCALLLPALLLAGAALVGTPAGARSEPAAAVGAPERARAILADPRYQTQLPQHEEPKDLS